MGDGVSEHIPDARALRDERDPVTPGLLAERRRSGMVRYGAKTRLHYVEAEARKSGSALLCLPSGEKLFVLHRQHPGYPYTEERSRNGEFAYRVFCNADDPSAPLSGAREGALRLLIEAATSGQGSV